MRSTPEREKAAAEFTAKMVAEIRKRLFADVPEKPWFQVNQRLVRLAVMAPAAWVEERGGVLPSSRYRIILMTCVIAVEEHGKREAVRNMGRYFLHVVQEHMRHHGEKYWEEAKAGMFVGAAMKDLMSVEARDVTQALAAGAAVLRSQAGRKKKAAGVQGELF